MSTLWNSTPGESGILRKSDQKDKLEDLLVFGYACKLFRDDEKAKEIDQGKHLIPWMGENSLKIDRYDCRGALSDLSLYEASKEGYDAMRWLGLSESERHLEQLCDEERYYSLHINEEEEEMYKEEEMKRLQNRGQVQYNYDVPPEPEGPALPQEDDDEPYVPRQELDIPVNMTAPTTIKQNTRIEKTALFISKEGPQMEILLKTKQANNPQFAFMNQEDPLYRYYRHVLMAIKTGRYKIQTEPPPPEIEEEKKPEEEHYLHPSLAAVTTTGQVESISTPPLTSVFYKPSANCAYSQLVNRIQGNQPAQEPVNPTPEMTNGVHAMYTQQAYIQHYQQYGYYPMYDGSNFYASYEQYKQYYEKNNPSNPYAQIVSNVKGKETAETIAVPENGTMVQGEYYNATSTEITKAPVLYNQQPEPEPQKVSKPKKTHLFSLAQYSGSESESEDEANQTDAHAVVVPPADMQLIVDKMASYVAKNGVDFENIVKSKGDPRFVFLDPSHIFHPYYKYKLKEFGGGPEKKETVKVEEKKEEVKVAVEVAKPEVKTEKKVAKPKDKKIITPVCFSIKKTKDEAVTRDKSALPVEDSTDEEEQNNKEEVTSNCSQTEENRDIGNSSEKNGDEISATENTSASQIIEIEDPIMELIDLTDELEDKRDAKRAEDRLKGKLALAAREKLAAKNKALQLERKKRAAAFLSQLKPTSNTKSEPVEEVKSVQPPASPPEEGEINGDTPPLHSMPDDLLRAVYHIEPAETKHEKNHRSRSPRHKSSHHRRKSHKRSHSHSKKRKRERRSHERKKSKRKRRSRSRSRSRSRHRKSEHESKTSKDKTADKSYSSSSSDSESEK